MTKTTRKDVDNARSALRALTSAIHAALSYAPDSLSIDVGRLIGRSLDDKAENVTNLTNAERSTRAAMAVVAMTRSESGVDDYVDGDRQKAVELFYDLRVLAESINKIYPILATRFVPFDQLLKILPILVELDDDRQDASEDATVDAALAELIDKLEQSLSAKEKGASPPVAAAAPTK